MQTLLRRIAVASVMVACASGLMSGESHSQDYPANRPITIINPLAAGGGVDSALRSLARELQTILKQTVVVESKPGAGGVLAGAFVARAEPDGHTIGLLQSSQALPEVYSETFKATYTSADVRPVARYMKLTYGMAAHPSVPYKDFKQFVAYAKANPEQIKLGRGGGAGISNPIGAYVFEMLNRLNIQILQVSFRGAGETQQALVGGHIDVVFPISVTAIEQSVKAGQLSALAMYGSSRSPNLPDVPTFAEQGYDAEAIPIYNTLFVPKATPDSVVLKIQNAVATAMQSPALKEAAERGGFDLYYGTGTEAAEEVEKDRAFMTAFLKKYPQPK